MLAAIYARKSTDQLGVSEDQRSVARQVENAKAYALAKGWPVNEACVFVDDGISGAEFLARPGFMRMLNALKPKAAFGVLIVSELSRLGREHFELGYYLKQLAQAGIVVHSYLEGRPIVLDSAIDKFMLSALTFAADVEREKARQRAYDTAARKARAGHVTGGRVFGYDNRDVLLPGPDGKPLRSHVERIVNEGEAAVVRRIYELAASGWGKKRIAAFLNEAGAPSPRAQRGRPGGWAPSSVFEVLNRPLYRGEVVWNSTRKRDRWGQQHQTARPEEEWLRLEAPHLQIVPSDLWRAASQRLEGSRARYLASTRGVPFGRPPGQVKSKYLLVGLACCSVCGAGLMVQTRPTHGRRSFRYACSTFHKRGRSVCGNSLPAPLEEADRLVIDGVREDLSPRVLSRGIEIMLEAFDLQDDGRRRLERLEEELADVEQAIGRLADAIAAGGDLSGLLSALRRREERRAELVRELALAPVSIARPDRRTVTREVEARVGQWRDLLEGNPAEARDVLGELLDGRAQFEPHAEAERPHYVISGRTAFGRVFEGICDPTWVASPAGFEPAS